MQKSYYKNHDVLRKKKKNSFEIMTKSELEWLCASKSNVSEMGKDEVFSEQLKIIRIYLIHTH